MYDAIVVGARCAGSPLSMLLARKGYRVLTLDRATFPSDTMSTHLIHAEGLARLAAWGLFDALVATDCPPIATGMAAIEGRSFEFSVPSVDGIDVTYCPRRTILDQLLVDAARAAGAEVREGVVVDGLLFDDDGTVIGVRARAGGAEFEERARIVVGADGRRSRVARAVDATQYLELPSTAFWYYNYVPAIDADPLLAFTGQIGCFLNPTHDGMTLVGVGGRAERFTEFKQDVAGNFVRWWQQSCPEIGAQLAAVSPAERFVGTADLPAFHRVPFGPGWALVGDAGLHKDPITGSGITEAFVQVELLAQAIDEGFSGQRPLVDAMRDYQDRRDAHTAAWYEWTHATAKLDPVPDAILDVFASLKDDRAGADRFAMLNAGLISMREFYMPFFAGVQN
jgi:flavin-dependent dehydrogenase